MVPYYILVAVPFLMSVVQFESHARQMTQKRKNWPILLFFAIYACLLAFRDVSIGLDTTRYSTLFDRYSVTAWDSIFTSLEKEGGYVILNKVVSSLHGDFRIFLFIVAGITVIPLAKLYYDESENSMTSIALFLILPVFLMNFSGIRQGLAISIGVWAFYMVKKKKLIPFILIVLLAMTFHASAFILFPMYPVYHMRFRKVHIFLFAPIYLLIFLFNEQIFRSVVPLLGSDYSEHLEALTDTGAYTMLVLFGIFLVYSFLVPAEDDMDNSTRGLRNLLLIAFALQMFTPLNRLAMRFNYYYILFIPVLIPRITSRFKWVSPFIRDVINIVMIVFFIGYYFLSTAGTDNLGIYPYVPFWA